MDSKNTVKYGLIGVAVLAILAMIAAIFAILFGVDISRLFF